MVAGGLVVGLALTACAASDRDTGGDDGATDGGRDTFIFAASGDPSSLDPAFASDGESFRVARQIFEGLVGVEPGTADPAPLLAESWEVSDDGLEYTFELKEGVTFHDGTDFDGDAVCANFERWNNFTGVLQSESLSYYWQKVNGGFASSDVESLNGTGKYESCEAPDAGTAVIHLRSPLPELVSALSLPAFAMQSPTALEEYDADGVSGDGEAPVLPEYATGHPTGTGPFVFESWSPGEEVVLSAYDDYWGEQGQVRRVVFPIISDATARRQALQAGDIDGYDLVGPADVVALEEAGFQIVNREPFNVLYLGMNQANPDLADVRVRQAIAHAINKEALVAQTLPEGTEVATNFVPPSVAGWNADVATYEYDPDKARSLLAEAGKSALTIDFNYPTNVSRPYMPTPEQVFTAIEADLEAVGITVNAVPDPWNPEYLDRIQGGADHGLHLLGWTGDYNDTYNFIGVFFGGTSNEWGFDNPELFTAINDARYVADLDAQTEAYEAANAAILDFLPGVPLAHPVPSLAFKADVQGYPASPVQDEVYNVITLGD
ncbi:ABC transporter substrate-binding protein [Cellulomonas sp. zg-ZUI222]|uniref:ABC transporter substrate-binding protein n=1 Tax=Cellulomonas wangleii TaxID=2816956 RepID=A0ABX8D9T6_9CELL|nr:MULTISPECIES: ABC transporter substrate-binding protein [Cellulomonas]MBO0900237.1 ABC transporter substrate-binding protein [Cellulomonas sp. zg-ZUI22]MBO0920849.1 ABC transporter substrate-binding protein [Cellulomonas wangleii]MBO0926555.1 ABC transporter substrate-binding protein [Cellulomonas wangleii]QVI64222.1 ABC transporter substrate-binding protein [Cellulomonas wangleii]